MKRTLTLAVLTILALGVMLQIEASNTRKGKLIASPRKAESAIAQRGTNPGATVTEEARLMSLENSLLSAVKSQDVSSVRNLVASDAFMANARASTKNADFFLDSLTSKQLVVNSVRIEDMKATILNSNAGIVTYYTKIDGSYFGLPFGDDWHYSSTCWAKKNGTWVVVYHQDTNLKYIPEEYAN